MKRNLLEQKLIAIILLLFTVLSTYILEDMTFAIISVPVGIGLLFTKEDCIDNDNYESDL